MSFIRLIAFLGSLAIITGFAFHEFPQLKEYTLNTLLPENNDHKTFGKIDDLLKQMDGNIKTAQSAKNQKELQSALDQNESIIKEAQTIIAETNKPQGALEEGLSTLSNVVRNFSGPTCSTPTPTP